MFIIKNFIFSEKGTAFFKALLDYYGNIEKELDNFTSDNGTIILIDGSTSQKTLHNKISEINVPNIAVIEDIDLEKLDSNYIVNNAIDLRTEKEIVGVV